MRPRRSHALLTLILILALGISAAHGAEVLLSWTAPTTKADGSVLDDLEGFNAYYGPAPGDYHTMLDVGLVTQVVIGGLTPGVTYWFTVTAYNLGEEESAQATPISYTVPPLTSDGPLAAYSFNAGKGSMLTDASGHGHHGTIVGASWTKNGKYGRALSFDGINDRVNIPDAPDLRLTTGMTLMAWVYPTSSAGTRDVLIKEGAGVDVYNLYARNWRGRPEINAFVDGGNRVAEGDPLPINRWTHLAGTYDGVSLRLYRDGVQVAEQAQTGPMTPSTGWLRMGGNSLWGHEYFKGRLDEVRLYNRALSQEEIQRDRQTAIK